MKHLYTYHGHTLYANTTPSEAPSSDVFSSDGVEVMAPTCAIPYVIAQAVVFAVKHNVRSLIVDGVEVKRIT